MISYGKQNINKSDIEAVGKALKSSLITQGSFSLKFENQLAKILKAKHCTVVSNGTAALNLVSRALKWDKNDLIITTPISFIASSNCIINQGSTPYFVDIDPITYTIDPNRIEDVIKKNKFIKKKLKAVIGVDYAGHPCDWVSLKYLSKKYNFNLINDNCHALGSKLNNDTGYALRYADIATLSFHPVKQITTGEGGAIFTNNKELNNLFKSLRSHGIYKNRNNFKNNGQWYHEFRELSSNHRLTDFQAALGISQLKRLNSFIKKRRTIAKIYNKSFGKDERFIIPNVKQNIFHSYHLYPLQINFQNLKISKKDFFSKMLKKRVKLQVHYIPITFQPLYKKISKKFNFELNNAIKFYKREFSIPIYYDLKPSEALSIANLIKKIAI